MAVIRAERYNYDTQEWEELEVDANLLSPIAWQGNRFTTQDQDIVDAVFQISETAKYMDLNPDGDVIKN